MRNSPDVVGTGNLTLKNQFTKLMIKLLFVCVTTAISISGLAQRSKMPMYFGEIVIIDSASVLAIPSKYNSGLLSTNKLALWDDYYANIIFYNFKTDSSRQLFPSSTFIRPFVQDRSYSYADTDRRVLMSRDWIFYFVKPVDYDESGRIDDEDPFILYVSDKQGGRLKALTPENENVVSVTLFDKLGFALVKMQRDANHDRHFKYGDKVFYYYRLDLTSLSAGRKIEIDR